MTRLLILFAIACARAPIGVAAATPAVDHHFHLLSPAGAALLKAQQPALADLEPIDGAAAVAALDSAGIGKAIVLSDAYFFDSPAAEKLPDSFRAMQAEN